jgi:hypothetical protein
MDGDTPVRPPVGAIRVPSVIERHVGEVARASRPQTARSAALKQGWEAPPAEAGETPAPLRTGGAPRRPWAGSPCHSRPAASPSTGWKPVPRRNGEATLAGETPAPLPFGRRQPPWSAALLRRFCFCRFWKCRCLGSAAEDCRTPRRARRPRHDAPRNLSSVIERHVGDVASGDKRMLCNGVHTLAVSNPSLRAQASGL